MTKSGIDPTTFQLVAQCFNQRPHSVLHQLFLTLLIYKGTELNFYFLLCHKCLQFNTTLIKAKQSRYIPGEAQRVPGS